VSFVADSAGWLVGRTTDEDGNDFLTPIRLAEMREWLESLGVDPADIALRAALVQRADGAYELHMTEHVRDEAGRKRLDLASGLPVSVPRIVEVADGSWPSWLLGLGL
jgi:hypothetical protein